MFKNSLYRIVIFIHSNEKKNIVNTVKNFCQLKGKPYILSFLICSLTCHRGLEDAESFL